MSPRDRIDWSCERPGRISRYGQGQCLRLSIFAPRVTDGCVARASCTATQYFTDSDVFFCLALVPEAGAGIRSTEKVRWPPVLCCVVIVWS